MHNRIEKLPRRWRAGRAMSAAVLCASGLVAACSEQATSPIRPSVPIAATTTGTIHVAGQPALYVFHGDVTGGGDGGHFAWSRPANIVVERQGQPAAELNWAAAASAEAGRVAADVTSRKLHFKDRDGRLMSLTIVDGADSRHPKAAYQFVDGRIQVIASFAYDVAGRPRQAVYTLFGDDGTAKIQMTQSFSVQSSASTANVFRGRATGRDLARRLATAVGGALLPAQLSAQGSGCSTGNVRSATTDMGAAGVAFMGCTVSIVCIPVIGSVFGAFVGATAGWAGMLMTC